MEKDFIQELGISPEEAEKLSLKELLQKAMDCCEQGDAEIDAIFHKDTAIAQQREGAHPPLISTIYGVTLPLTERNNRI